MQSFIRSQFQRNDWILKPFFLLRQGNLSCSNCHINWFCLTEPNVQHFQDVILSLWLRRIQVWLPITVGHFCAFLWANTHLESVLTLVKFVKLEDPEMKETPLLFRIEDGSLDRNITVRTCRHTTETETCYSAETHSISAIVIVLF